MDPWTDELLRTRAGWILRSYRHWDGAELIALPAGADDDARARALFDAPLGILAHGIEDDPLCIYANGTALAAFELPIADAPRFPTRETAAPEDRAERSGALARSGEQGIVYDYDGIRVSRSGRRFRLLDGRIWTVLDDDGKRIGQAAAFVAGEI